MSYITVSYLTEAKSLEKKAEAIAVGMTVGSWTDLPAAKQEKLQKHLGRSAGATVYETTAEGLERGLIKVEYPVVNFTYDIPSLLTNVFGKLSMDGKIRLVDIDFPQEFTREFSGPKFGISGIRELLNVHDRPLFMSIFKSCIGLPLDELVEQFKLQVEGGVDLVKDDEIFFADEHAPFLDRIRACKEVTEASGRQVLYAVNLTGPVTGLVDKAKRAIENGANCLLLNVLPYGFDILAQLSRDPDINVPIMAHPAMAGALYQSSTYGISSPLVLGKLMRLAGADIGLFPSPYGSVALPRQEALDIATHLVEEIPGIKPTFPVPSAGIHPGMVPLLYKDFGLNHIVNAGGGIHGHPGGPVSGGQAFVAAIEATMQGIPLEQSKSQELLTAIEKWGIVK
ncbi:2,3-diketo-5-methylthiopentyl-1-phosphate enolase [Ammoniphilus sp. CFH 90114]|uniref:2,3-diketo-5-methylthiopentyl-1-phosphate enolase n=1 Tax=Ammoniphilus sp. CFH 90114 TaxID=2493665 RepID=UPI00100F7610|nr:2,3-diketo-5-methylthiopentyl-1-phosphate enolase [Ammoniphilus sp. CFH 90114]RXT04839.1 2,3-diketo-5-methylthiopentyl-1-phosphate enolase [Ammoniphilus sp. CFH 90114]